MATTVTNETRLQIGTALEMLEGDPQTCPRFDPPDALVNLTCLDRVADNPTLADTPTDEYVCARCHAIEILRVVAKAMS